MNETLKQFTEQLALDLKGKLSSEEMVSFVAKTKEAGDDRTFEVVMSTSDEDRQGDSLDQSTWDFKYFDMNPVVLFAHDYSSFPIGIITDIEIKGNEAVATGKFAPKGINPAADMACELYQQKILRAVSPGYIQNDDGTRELLEVSFCPVPAGRYALSLRQVRALGISTRELVTKGFFYVEKAEKPGDSCEMDDGSPGVLAEDAGDPGKLVCVPTEAKKQNKNNMEEKLKAEHERHGEAVGKAIDEFTEKCMKSEKSEGEKAIEEYTKAMDGEQADHLEKCMKAIDENYELQDQAPKKSIDEFKSEMTDEHLTHVKACDKAIEEFKGEFPALGENDDKKKSIDVFTKAMGDELDRHEKCHMDMVKAEMGEGEDDEKKKKKGAVAEELAEDELLQQKYKKLDNAYSVFYAFTSAYMDESVAVDDFEKLLDEAVVLMKDIKGKATTAVLAKALFNKSGRAISSANQEKIKAVIKAVEDHHTAQTAEHEKATNDVIASLKELMGSPQDDEGQKPEKAAAPKPRSITSGASELDTYLFIQRVVRQINTTTEGTLRQIKEKIKETRSGS